MQKVPFFKKCIFHILKKPRETRFVNHGSPHCFGDLPWVATQCSPFHFQTRILFFVFPPVVKSEVFLTAGIIVADVVGAGILAMPVAIANFGLYPGIVVSKSQLMYGRGVTSGDFVWQF